MPNNTSGIGSWPRNICGLELFLGPKYFWWPKLVPKFRCPNSVAKWFPKECAQNRWPKKVVYFGPHTSQKSALNYLGHTHLFFWSSWGTFWATIWGTYLGHKFGAQISQIWGTIFTNLGHTFWDTNFGPQICGTYLSTYLGFVSGHIFGTQIWGKYENG